MSPVTINGNLVDLDSNHPKNALFSHSASGAGSKYILVQTKDALSKQEKGELRDLGAQLEEYVAENIYLFRYEPNDLKPVRDKGFVSKAGIYAKGLKITADLKISTNIAPHTPRDISVVLHEEKDLQVSEIVSELADAAGIEQSQVLVDGNKIKLTVDPDKLDVLAAVDSVRTIEEAPEKILYNNIARGILDAEILLNDTPYQGEGQIVAVADTGLDNGDINNIHPAFKGRIKELIPIGRPSKVNDTDGHGTHVCGSVLGGKVTDSLGGMIQGMAPQASLVMQSLLNESRGLFPRGGYSLSKLFLGPYEKYGACIHSNSWGAGWTGKQLPYDDEAKEIDQCVWDNPDILICFAAGNDGHKTNAPTLGSQAAAKNCLTVGATESSRPSADGVFLESKTSLNDPTEISWYSNRGPTQEGRIKPDIVAPGTAILSAKSRASPKSSDFGKSPDPLYMFSTGTSMATPLVAGCAAVLREVLIKNGIERPSAALLKALLINGAFTLHHAHSAKEGFGRVSLKNSIILPGQAGDANFVIGEPLEDRGESRTISVTIPSKTPAVHPNGEIMSGLRVNPPSGQGVTLKTTLVYTDAPGLMLQNDLNLIVTTSDGARRHGNMGSSTQFDTANNVEQIVWKGIPAGEARITVRASRVVTDKQDYVLVWRIIPNEE